MSRDFPSEARQHSIFHPEAGAQGPGIAGTLLCHFESVLRKGMNPIRHMPGIDATKLSPKNRQ